MTIGKQDNVQGDTIHKHACSQVLLAQLLEIVWDCSSCSAMSVLGRH